jgi:fructoselysine 6-kinase
MKIVCVGDIGIDSYTNKKINKPGGVAFNVALCTRDSGAETSLISALGDDIGSSALRKLLTRLDVDTSHVQILKGKTAKQSIALELNGERKFIGYNAGVLEKWKLSKNDIKFIQTHDAIFTPLSDGMEHIFNEILKLKTKGMKAVDFSQDYEKADLGKPVNIVTKYSPYFDIICIGGSKDHIQLVNSLSKKYPKKAFVLTFGKEGSIGYFQKKEYIQSVVPVSKIVDSTGCGDAFQGSFIVNFIESHDMKKSLQLASQKAADTLKHIGSTMYSL